MRRLIVLRPEPGASETVRRAEAMELDAAALPLFVIEPIGWSVPEPGAFDAILLTSANAVRQSGDGLNLLRSLPTHAVGEATAAAARAAGLNVATTGSQGVEQLLDGLPSGLRLLHLCGEHRRLPSRVRQSIISVAVYRSQAVRPPNLASISDQVAAVHSPRAGARLAGLVGGEARSTIRLAAISRAAAEAAGNGWECVEIAAAPNDTELLALAARLCEKSDPQ
jgi:uroporphyrinogen-III synthase